jgi:aminotransferase
MKDSKSLHEKIASSVRSIPKSGIRDFFDLVNEMEDTISLGVGEPGFPAPWHVRDSAIYALERGATSYTSNLGLKELRDEISRYVEDFFGAYFDPEREILVTTGVSEGLDLAIRALVNPGDEIIYHEPCYVSYRPVILLAHGKPVVIKTELKDQFRLDIEKLAELITPRTKALILNYPNNPTGAILTEHELHQIAELAIQNDLLILSDEIYAELTYDRNHKSIVSIPELKERTILFHGFSKSWAMTGFRIAYCCAPGELLEAMMTIHQYTMLCAPTLSQVAAIEALERAEYDVPELKKKFFLNRNLITASLKEMGLPLARPLGAFYAFPRVDSLGLDSQTFATRLLKEERVAVVPGEAFGECGENFVRCSFSTSTENIKEAMKRMKRFVAKLQQEQSLRTRLELKRA